MQYFPDPEVNSEVWKFSIKNHLHVKPVLMRYHLSMYVQWFGRDALTKEKPEKPLEFYV